MCTNSNTDVSCKHNLIKIPTLKMKQDPYNKRKVRIICSFVFQLHKHQYKGITLSQDAYWGPCPDFKFSCYWRWERWVPVWPDLRLYVVSLRLDRQQGSFSVHRFLSRSHWRRGQDHRCTVQPVTCSSTAHFPTKSLSTLAENELLPAALAIVLTVFVSHWTPLFK